MTYITIPPVQVQCGDSRTLLAAYPEAVDLIITSPPYANARKTHYPSVTPEAYPDWLATFHRVFWQALKPTGSLVLNLKGKVVNGVRHRYVWRTIDLLTELGWYCVEDYIWCKKTAMPGYWPTRFRDAWEYCYHLAKCPRPYINQAAVRIPIAKSTQKRMTTLSAQDQMRRSSATGSGFGKKVSYWTDKTTVAPTNVLHLCPENRHRHHPAAFPVSLPTFFIQLLSPPEGFIVDPFAGSGSTGVAALQLGRKALLIDIEPRYCAVAIERLRKLR